MNSGRYILSVPRQKNVEFSAQSVDLVDSKDVLLASSEYAVSQSHVLHCNASNLMLEIFNHYKIFGDNLH